VSLSSRSLVVLVLIGALALAVPSAPAAAAPPAACSPDAELAGFSDALDKTSFAGTDVGGLSALTISARRGDTGQALVDNQSTTPARLYDLQLSRRPSGPTDPRVTGLTIIRRPDGTPYTGTDFDGEGMVSLSGGSFIASSETEPSIRSFASSGRQRAELPVPGRFRVAPLGEASVNQTFEGLGLAPDGRTLWAGRAPGAGRHHRRRGPPPAPAAV
jgi:hypothetical protein